VGLTAIAAPPLATPVPVRLSDAPTIPVAVAVANPVTEATAVGLKRMTTVQLAAFAKAAGQVFDCIENSDTGVTAIASEVVGAPELLVSVKVASDCAPTTTFPNA
jgi:hypothetical protein